MILQAEKIIKHYASRSILSAVSLQVRPGESVAITGRSGEGKTTLLQILGTLEAADHGSVTIAGELCTQKNAPRIRRQAVGFIFQAFHLLEEFTALENVLLPASIARKKESRMKGLSLLEQVGLVECAHTPAKLLSGGERQRVAIARALCNDPCLILADEPTGNLDEENGEAIGKLLLSLTQNRNAALVIATHDPHLASLCNRRLTLKKGLLEEPVAKLALERGFDDFSTESVLRKPK